MKNITGNKEYCLQLARLLKSRMFSEMNCTSPTQNFCLNGFFFFLHEKLSGEPATLPAGLSPQGFIRDSCFTRMFLCWRPAALGSHCPWEAETLLAHVGRRG